MNPLTFDELFRLASVDCGEASILAQEALRIMVRYTLPQDKPEPPDEECQPYVSDKPVEYDLTWMQLKQLVIATEGKVRSLEEENERGIKEYRAVLAEKDRMIALAQSKIKEMLAKSSERETALKEAEAKVQALGEVLTGEGYNPSVVLEAGRRKT